MNRRLLASFAFLCVTLSSFSQKKNASTLLWRISGNGLKQSSYLFGTMHLTDKRLFNFDDSLYHALEITEGTAIEVNPDEMMAYTFNKELDDIQNGRSLKDILSESDYKKYSAALAKKMNKPASEITEKDLLLEKNSWTTDYLAKGEMPTFVDAYLFYTAKKQAKWVGGIEDITDQAGLLENIDKTDIEFMLKKDAKDVADNMMERMITLYGMQDIDELYKFASGEDSAKHDAVITRRNIKMAYRIDSIAHTRSMLFAIGAAHLASDEGLINLLRKRGFTVTPVMGSKKISSKDYKYVEKPIPWNAVGDKQGLYSAMMPGTPFATKLMGVVDAKFYFDLSSFTGYWTMATLSSVKFENRDSLYRRFATAVFKNGQKIKSTPVNKNGVEGVEYVAPIENLNARVQLFMKDNVVFVPMFYALKKDSLYGTNAKKFFDSFVINDIPKTEEKLYYDTTAGIVVTFPIPLEYNSQMSSAGVNGWNIRTYMGTDINTGVYIAKFDKAPVRGNYITSDSTIFAETRKAMQLRMKETKYEEMKIAGCNASYFEGEANGLQGRFLNVIRGNHNLGLMVAGDSSTAHKAVYDNIFKNIKLVPHKPVQWKTTALANKSLTVWAPAEFTDNSVDSALAENHFLTYDSSSLSTIIISADTLPKYTWYSSDSAFWSATSKFLLVNGDSMVSSIRSKKGKVGMSEMLIMMKKTGSYSRVKQYLYGNVAYQILMRGELDNVTSIDADKLMNDVQFNNKPIDFDITESKTALLLNDLLSKDSSVVGTAYTELRTVNLDSSDAEPLANSLLKKYQAPYSYNDSSDINYRIAKRLSEFASPNTISFVCANYNNLTGDKQYLRMNVLDLLGITHSKQSYDSLFSLLKAHPTDAIPRGLAYDLADSIELLANYTDDILSFVKDTARGMQMTSLINLLSDSSLITLDKLKKYENDFVALAKHSISKSDANWRCSDLIEVLGKIKTQKSFTAIRGYLNIKDAKRIRKDAVVALIKNNQTVNATVLNSMAADREIRLPLYSALKDIKKQSLFPKLYLTQKMLGESALYEAASDDYSIKAMKFVAEKTATYQGKKYKFYLFKVTLDEEEGSYLGVAGAYDIAGKFFEPKEDITSLHYEEEFDAAKVNEQFDAWLQSYAREDE